MWRPLGMAALWGLFFAGLALGWWALFDGTYSLLFGPTTELSVRLKVLWTAIAAMLCMPLLTYGSVLWSKRYRERRKVRQYLSRPAPTGEIEPVQLTARERARIEHARNEKQRTYGDREPT